MKKHRIYFYGLLFAAFLFCAGPHLVQAKSYDADGNTIGAENNDPDEADDASDKGDDNEDEMPPVKNTDTSPAVHPHKIVPTADMATTPPQPPAHTMDEPEPSAAPVSSPLPASAPTPSSKGGWWHPHPGTKWQIQFSGKLDTSAKVGAFDLDLVETDPAVIQQLHSRGVKVMCYFSAGSYEGWRPDARQFPASVMGKPNGWKDEKWLDIRRADILRPIMKARIEMAAQKGCDAVDPDNVEAFENNSGFPLKSHDQLAYNKMIAELAHNAGMAVGLKNDLSQAEELLPYFDFEVNEQCFEYQSCNDAIPFIKANKPVFNIEYKESPGQFCTQANKMNFDSLKKNLDLDAKVQACR